MTGPLLWLLLALPSAAGLWGPLIDPLAETKTAFESRQYVEVIRRLSPESMQKLNHDALARAYLYLGSSYAGAGRLGQALSTFQLAIKLFPKDINLLSETGSLLHLSGLDEQAQPLFEKVLQIHPNNARAHLGLGEIDRSLGFLDRSAVHYSRALATMPDRADVWRDYAEVLLAQKDAASAETAVRKSLSLADERDARVDLAFIERALGRQDAAIADLDEVVKKSRDDNAVALTRALWCVEAGRWDEAKKGANDRLNADDKDPLALWILARAALHEGRAKDAAEYLRRAAQNGERARFAADAAAAFLAGLEAPR